MKAKIITGFFMFSPEPRPNTIETYRKHMFCNQLLNKVVRYYSNECEVGSINEACAKNGISSAMKLFDESRSVNFF